MRTETIESLPELLQRVVELFTGSQFVLFRGQSCDDWGLSPRLARLNFRILYKSSLLEAEGTMFEEFLRLLPRICPVARSRHLGTNWHLRSTMAFPRGCWTGQQILSSRFGSQSRNHLKEIEMLRSGSTTPTKPTSCEQSRHHSQFIEPSSSDRVTTIPELSRRLAGSPPITTRPNLTRLLELTAPSRISRNLSSL